MDVELGDVGDHKQIAFRKARQPELLGERVVLPAFRRSVRGGAWTRLLLKASRQTGSVQFRLHIGIFVAEQQMAAFRPFQSNAIGWSIAE